MDKIHIKCSNGIFLYTNSNFFSKTFMIPFEISDRALYFFGFEIIYPFFSGEIFIISKSSRYFMVCIRLYGFKEILSIISEKYSKFSSLLVLVNS